MDQRVFIAQLNIEHFRRRLDGQLDDALRRLIERLLAEEEAKLLSLRASIAEGILSRLLDLVGSWASGLTDDRDARAVELATVFDEMPCGMSLIDSLGKIALANEAMDRFVSEEIPSRDPQRIKRWRLFGSDGQTLDPTMWPGARALRGESVNPGLAAVCIGDDGQETALRIAAVPVTARDGSIFGAIGATYELSTLERQEVHDVLERMLVEEQFRSRRRGREGSKR